MFRYITDVLTPEAALTMLKAKEAGKREREATVRKIGQVESDPQHSLPLNPGYHIGTLRISLRLDGSVCLSAVLSEPFSRSGWDRLFR